MQYANVLALAHSTGVIPQLDSSVDEPTFTYTRAGVTHRVWYMDAPSIATRLRIARSYGLQAGVWRLGEEDQSLWSSPAVVEGGLG
jgi:spore germination protein YaaH